MGYRPIAAWEDKDDGPAPRGSCFSRVPKSLSALGNPGFDSDPEVLQASQRRWIGWGWCYDGARSGGAV